MLENKTIFIQGMCYSGKTSVGTLLAQRLNTKFLDSRYIFYNYWKEYDLDYLKKYGKEKFQNAEKESLQQDFNKQGIGVVALSGSSLYLDSIMTSLYENKYNNIIILLNASYDTILKRKSIDEAIYGHRPIVYPDSVNSFQELYDTRKSIYIKYSHLCVEILDNDTKDDVVDLIIASIYTQWPQLQPIQDDDDTRPSEDTDEPNISPM